MLNKQARVGRVQTGTDELYEYIMLKLHLCPMNHLIFPDTSIIPFTSLYSQYNIMLDYIGKFDRLKWQVGLFWQVCLIDMASWIVVVSWMSVGKVTAGQPDRHLEQPSPVS